MTIRRKLFLSNAILIIVSMIIGGIVLFSAERIDKSAEIGQKSSRIVREIFQLTLLLNDYLTHREERPAKQWQIKHQHIGELLAEQRYENPRDQAIHEDIIEIHASAAKDFSQLINASQNSNAQALEDRLTSLLLVKSQSMVSKSVVLSEKSFAQQRQIRQSTVLILGVVIGILLISTTTLLILLYKSLVSPLTKLNKGTQKVAAGNWNYKVDIKSNDEIGQLATAFNSMSAKINSYINKQKKLEKQKDDFIGAASHELKTPLTSLTLYTQSLSHTFQKTKNSKAKDTIQKVDRQLKRLQTIVNDLLEAQKIIGGRLKYAFTFFNINAFITKTVQEAQLSTPIHNLVLKLAKDATVYGNKEYLEQVLTNFISNAVKYSPNKKQVIISTTIHKDEVIVGFRDFGIGIAKKNHKKVFDRFYRVEGEVEKTFPGIGLGLYIASQIIKHHKGKIWVESQEGKGSTFFFSLPIRQQHPAESKQ